MNHVSSKPAGMYIVLLVIIVILLTVTVFACYGYYPFRKHVKITEEPIYLESDKLQYTNNTQYQASVWMSSYQHELYFYPHTSSSVRKNIYDGWLCVLHNQQVVKLCKLDHERLRMIGSAEGCVYYVVYGKNIDSNDTLYCFDVNRMQETVLYTGRLSNSYTTVVLLADGTLSIPFFAEETDKAPKYLHVAHGKVAGIADHPEYFTLNMNRYAVVADQYEYRERIIMIDECGNETDLPLEPATLRALIPDSSGLLVHNEGYGRLLYRINADGRLSSLFELSCVHSNSAVAVVKDNIYLSVKRYEKFGNLGMRRYENDAAEGTYMISLLDLSVIKISDQIYNGLYYFGGEVLYACDEDCNIYLLDLQGNLLDAILKVVGINE